MAMRDYLDRAFRFCAFVVVLPYGNIYRQNTRDPLAAFIRGSDNDAAFAGMKEWSEMKLREVQYVQVAGALLFSSLVSALSWTTVQASHWSGPACWYAGIVWSLLAIVLGAQQSMVVPNACKSPGQLDMLRKKVMVGGHGRGDAMLGKRVESEYGSRNVTRWIDRAKDALKREKEAEEKGGKGGGEEEKGQEHDDHHRHHHHFHRNHDEHDEEHHQRPRSQPSHMVLFALQAPLMCLTYSIIFFLAGLTSVVLSPLAENPGWNSDAKTTVLFLVASGVLSITFIATSVVLNDLDKT
ncbi:MAG: hypothetical protein M1831_005646 [Alyxoria varia]|nr:MAG: hypothetical protein M1831_005646 [Alyxoria varia]